MIGLGALTCSLAPAQQATAPAMPLKGKKVCVADIANSSMQPIFADRVKQALVEALQSKQANVDNTYTVTMLATHLALSGNNRIVFRREKCDFMLLTEVARVGVAPTSPINTDHPRPSALLSVNFAVFRKGRLSIPLRTDSIPVAASDDPTSAASAAMENIAAEIIVALKSK
jgi:hypothetical protein